MKVALTIAGSDSSGGAGIQGDLKTFQSLGVYGMSVVTAVTVQNTQKVYFVCEMDPAIVRSQILCLFEDIAIDVIKIGMISNAEIAIVIADTLKLLNFHPIILDPVMISKSGYSLLSDKAKEIMLKELIPMSFVVTPNLYEAEILSGYTIKNIEDMKRAAFIIYNMGAKNVVIKGGHLKSQLAIDVAFNGKDFKFLKTRRINTINTHGTGCTFASALAAYMIKDNNFFEALYSAKDYISQAIANSIDIGKGCGPTNHFFNMQDHVD